jgi:glycosyltransferase involved in cell wall biosynthesis
MWDMTLPPRLARLGRRIEFSVAPPLYRHTPIVTLSSSSKQELVQKLHLSPEQISVVPPGVDARFAPGGERSATPLVVAVGRLVPVKRQHLLIDALAGIKSRVPDLRAVLVGEGYERESLETHLHEVGADDWITLAGRVDDAALVDLYRRAWVLASASAHEGWGMTVTEAAACGTPAVVTRIAGHADAVVHERTGLLVDEPSQLGPALHRVLTDHDLRASLSANALTHASGFTWEATARGTLEVLANEALRRRRS